MTEYTGIGLKRPATIPLEIVDFVIVVIKVVTMVDVDICLKRLATLTIKILEQEFMFPGDVDIGIRPFTLPPIT